MRTILFGFEAPLFQAEISELLKRKGVEVKIEAKFTKNSIRDYIMMHEECDTVILKEKSDSCEYTADELALLADERDLNIVVVLMANHKGTSYMQTLYAANILGAIFQSGRSGGAKVEDVAALILKKRTRKEARDYYGIGNVEVDIGILSPEAFSYYYSCLSNPEYGDLMIERYLTVAQKLTAKQNEDFIRKLPKDTLEELSSYAEFYEVLAQLKTYGVDIKMKKPKNAKIAKEEKRAMLAIEQQSDDMKGVGAVMVDNNNNYGAENEEYFDFGFDAGNTSNTTAQPVQNVAPVATDESIYKEEKVKTNSVPDLKYDESDGDKHRIIFLIIVAVVLAIVVSIVCFACGKDGGNWLSNLLKKDVVEEVVSEEPSVSEEQSSEVEEVSEEQESEEESLDFEEEESVNEEILSEDVMSLPDNLESEYKDLSTKLIDGSVMNGISVVNCINANTNVRFRVISLYNNENLIYVSGGASVSDIAADGSFRVSFVNDEYVFTQIE